MARLEESCIKGTAPAMKRCHLHAAIAAWVVGCTTLPAVAEESSRLFSNPPDLQQQAPSQAISGQTTLLMRSGVEKSAPGKLLLPAPRSGSERQLTLNIGFTEGHIYDPSKPENKLGFPVRLRSYSGPDVDPDAPYVAPTINATPGDTIRITLNNNLPKDPSCFTDNSKKEKPGSASKEKAKTVNVPHCFNGTNLHSHGLWVSPTGNSDNVLLSINPGVSFQYEYNIPEDHPAGTFWYHPHRHGSTALQVGSGMAGALIIRGDRTPKPESNGDIDTLLKGTNREVFTERLIVLQQIPYGCLDPKTKKYVWDCKEGQVGEVQSYEDQFDFKSWQQSGRYTSINGKVQPIFKTEQSGQIERWRFVHAGVRDTVVPQFRKLAQAAVSLSENGVSADKSDAFIAKNCTGEPVPYQVIASDGLTMDKAQEQTQVPLQPGYRNDILVMFPEPGRYCLVDKPLSLDGSVDQTPGDRQILGFVDVETGPTIAISNLKSAITDELVKAAKLNMPSDVQEQIIGDLQNDLKLTRFTPHKSVTDEELKKSGDLQQNLVFLIKKLESGDSEFAVGDTADKAAPYDPEAIPRQLTLGTAETWKLESAAGSHPFHIHVNPFQIYKIIGPDGTDLSESGAVDKSDPKDPSQYSGLKGVWKDTLMVKGPVNDKPYKIYVRTRYQRYIGEFVLHCHILDHEDQGMMQNVNISIPDGNGGNAGSSSHH